MSKISDSKLKATLEAYFRTGATHVSDETLNRYMRKAKQRFPEWITDVSREPIETPGIDDRELADIITKAEISAEELKRILQYTRDRAPKRRQVFKDYFGKKIKIGVFSDPHIGHEMFDEALFRHMVSEFENREVEKIYCIGDILEGMSGRDGHIYELSEIGFSQQIKKAVRLFDMLPADIYSITGNHDLWYFIRNNGGIDVGEALSERLENFHYLGQNEAFVEIMPGKMMHLFHPNDGSAYALSYKLQKLIETYMGGEKPLITLEGHYHKALYMFERNIHALECGTLSGQSWFMRGKKAAARKGFWIIEIELGPAGMGRFAPEFFPGYK